VTRTTKFAMASYMLTWCSAFPVLAIALASGAQVPVPGNCATPVAERTSEVGCYVDANESLGELPAAPIFWHIYNFPTKAAAESAKPPHGTVVESFGVIRLYAIASVDWHPQAGQRVAVIGPLSIVPDRKYTARYMEATFAPGMAARAHEHSGPEAFYVVSGTQCLETSDGMTLSRAGESAVAPQGSFMTVRGVGKEVRRALVVVLHDTDQAWQSFASDWKPKGLCPE
jgi:quercetin dioxygenase-like cupin family protein